VVAQCKKEGKSVHVYYYALQNLKLVQENLLLLKSNPFYNLIMCLPSTVYTPVM